MDDEYEMTEMAFEEIKRKECKHELVETMVKGMTQDSRLYTKTVITCKKDCGYYRVKKVEEEPVSEEIIKRC